jgi:hypothetical protein
LQDIPLRINEHIFKLTTQFAVEKIDLGSVLASLEGLERAIISSELSISKQEKTFQRLLNQCKVVYNNGKNSAVGGARNPVYNSVKDSAIRVVLLSLFLFLSFFGIYRGIKWTQKYLEMKIKKSK